MTSRFPDDEVQGMADAARHRREAARQEADRERRRATRDRESAAAEEEERARRAREREREAEASVGAFLRRFRDWAQTNRIRPDAGGAGGMFSPSTRGWTVHRKEWTEIRHYLMYGDEMEQDYACHEVLVLRRSDLRVYRESTTKSGRSGPSRLTFTECETYLPDMKRFVAENYVR